MVYSASRRTQMAASMSNQGSHLNGFPGLPSTIGVPSSVRMVYKCGGPMSSCTIPKDAVLGLAWLKAKGLYNTRKTNGGIGRNANMVHQNCCASAS
jgi:hypothetical protein